MDEDTIQDMICEIEHMMEVAECDYDLLDALDNVGMILRSMLQ